MEFSSRWPDADAQQFCTPPNDVMVRKIAARFFLSLEAIFFRKRCCYFIFAKLVLRFLLQHDYSIMQCTLTKVFFFESLELLAGLLMFFSGGPVVLVKEWVLYGRPYTFSDLRGFLHRQMR